LSNRPFIIYGSIICFCIPCILMLVTYSLTIRRLQLEAAKCYSDPDDHLMIKQQNSERLRRHRSSSKRQLSSKNQKNASSKDISNSTPASPTLPDTDNKQNHLQWP
jgi:hypothetical protein